jgi:hypothetical protein
MDDGGAIRPVFGMASENRTDLHWAVSQADAFGLRDAQPILMVLIFLSPRIAPTDTERRT